MFLKHLIISISYINTPDRTLSLNFLDPHIKVLYQSRTNRNDNCKVKRKRLNFLFREIFVFTAE